MQAPSAPTFNAQQAARDQTSSNVNTAAANAYLGAQNQYTPWGNLIYKETGQHKIGVGQDIVPEFSVTTELSPQQQTMLDKTQALQTQGLNLAGDVLGRVGTSVKSPLDYSSLPAVAPSTLNLTMPGDQTKFKNDAYSALMARQNQEFNTQDEALRAQLANQGISYGADAYDKAYRPLNQSRVDASNQALLNATGLAGQNINQQLGMNAQQMQLANQNYSQSLSARQQALNEYMAKRNQPLMDYQALLGLSNGVQHPQWAPSIQAQVAPTDVIGPQVAQYQGQMNHYNQQLGANNAMMGGLFGLGGSLLGGAMLGPLGAGLGGMLGGTAARAAGVPR